MSMLNLMTQLRTVCSNQTVLFLFEQTVLSWVIKFSVLKKVQQFLLFRSLLLKSLSFLFRGLESHGRGLPPLPCRPRRVQSFCESSPTQLIQPTALLTRPRELLRLSLNG